MCRPGLGELFLKEKLVDDVIEVNKKNRSSVKEAWKSLSEKEWTRIFCPHESFRTAFWVRSLRVKEFSVGFKKPWNFWAFTKRIEKPMDQPDALRQLSLLKINREFENLWDQQVRAQWLNSNEKTKLSYLNEPSIPEWASMRIAKPVERLRKIFLAPGSVWPTKRWSEKGFEQLAIKLKDLAYEVFFVGSHAEAELCEHLAKNSKAVSLAGKTTLYSLVEEFRTGQLLVCNDSGAMHAAAVADLPVVSIFGPTVLKFGFRPWQSKAIVVQHDLPCRPCASHGGKTCPIKTHVCMKGIESNEVLDLILRSNLLR